jgi:hypothetical protein
MVWCLLSLKGRTYDVMYFLISLWCKNCSSHLIFLHYLAIYAKDKKLNQYDSHLCFSSKRFWIKEPVKEFDWPRNRVTENKLSEHRRYQCLLLKYIWAKIRGSMNCELLREYSSDRIIYRSLYWGSSCGWCNVQNILRWSKTKSVLISTLSIKRLNTLFGE